MLYLQLLIVLIAANGAPIIGRLLLGTRWDTPIDRGASLWDGRPVLGHSKTYRGFAFGVVTAGLFAEVVALPFEVGLLMGGLAMCGDCLSSFLKRRLGLQPEAMALGLDQIPESAIPLLGVKSLYGLSWMGIGATVAGFWMADMALSFVFYRIGLRKHPY